MKILQNSKYHRKYTASQEVRVKRRGKSFTAPKVILVARQTLGVERPNKPTF
jgi:hypothetical protein